jgi:hypothetical protein
LLPHFAVDPAAVAIRRPGLFEIVKTSPFIRLTDHDEKTRIVREHQRETETHRCG